MLIKEKIDNGIVKGEEITQDFEVLKKIVLPMYCVYDEINHQYGVPFCCENQADAERHFVSLLYKNFALCDEIKLCHLGDFAPYSAKINLYSCPKIIMNSAKVNNYCKNIFNVYEEWKENDKEFRKKEEEKGKELKNEK